MRARVVMPHVRNHCEKMHVSAPDECPETGADAKNVRDMGCWHWARLTGQEVVWDHSQVVALVWGRSGAEAIRGTGLQVN